MARLQSLHLHYFRNHFDVKVDLDEDIVVIVGDNGQGKTSLVEAAYLMATGTSFRADRAEEMVSFDQELARVTAKLSTDDTLEVIVTRGMVQGKRTQARLFSVNQVRRRRKDFIGYLSAVVFRPEDMRLMEGSPSRRRTFMDSALIQSHPSYAVSLTTYEQALLRRNKILQAVREREMPVTVLTYWNNLIIKHGQVIQDARTRFLDSFSTTEFPVAFEVTYVPSLMSAERLAEYQPREIAAGHTLIGPHKDDFEVKFQWRPGQAWQTVSTYGSRGQQRMAVLWLKLAELSYLKTTNDQLPLLLLDDIFSELDHEVRGLVMQLMTAQPTIVTTTESQVAADLERELPKVQILTLE